ncbi:DUF1212-domain-containing protein [Punctularia strigosozonata HHB-11173 SS5]|uniref:DUF1212-domain-containing protein n=1 Tax=Punctularia strigosozonata (strain HHB-11173) TaxID=741275 RepID=UPI0004416EAF|nr:DUF1212-domain-containing protein [Punctularia strigosozonata HHB-11173 SS5]EIN14060.1 DUF1212-domain-containing protein [Punctularia strigosozonata HHB-11173 SS5]
MAILESKERRMFLLVLAKALMSFGAPSHRVEAHLEHCSSKLGIRSAFIQFPNIVIGVFFRNVTGTASIHFVRASGKVALTSLHKVHLVYRRVLHEKKDVGEARQELIEIIKSPPRYPRWKRCIFAFFQGAIICSLSFGGSLLDVFVGGVFTASVQWLNLYAVSRSAAYANVFDITSAIIVALCARLLSGIPGNVFCYNAISSAGIVLVLPGFNVLVSSLELISLSVLSGPVRMVYAIMYTMFLGFSLNAGSEIYFSAWPKARTQLEAAAVALTTKDSFYGSATLLNGTIELEPFDATFTVADTASASRFIVQGSSHALFSSDIDRQGAGCFRDPHWPWWRQLLPWWTMLFLVPVYATLSCMSNLQSWRSKQFPVMICFSIATYAANRAARIAYPNQASFIAAAGATVIGFLGNLYGRIWRGSAFTTMVPGVLFLVPSALSGENGLNPSYSTTSNATTQFSVGFQLGIRMVQVALGVMAGVYVGESIAYVGGRRRKRNTPFAF